MGETIGDRWSVGRARWVLADLAAYVDLDMWRPLSRRCVDALTQSGDRFALAYARLWQAVPYLMRGYQPQGIAALRDAASGVADIANPTLNAAYVIWQGWAALQAGELCRADQLATEVMAGPGFRLATQRLFGELLLAAAARHRGVYQPILDEFPDKAASALRHGEVLAAVMYRHWEAFCLLFSDPPAARHRAEETIALYGSSYGSVACALHLTATLAALAMGDGKAAWAHSDAAEAFTAPMKWPLNRTRQLLVRALLLVRDNDVAAARTTAVEQVVLAHEQGLAIELVYGLEALAVIAAADNTFVDTARLLGVATTMRGKMEMAGEFLPLSALVEKSVLRAQETFGPRHLRYCQHGRSGTHAGRGGGWPVETNGDPEWQGLGPQRRVRRRQSSCRRGHGITPDELDMGSRTQQSDGGSRRLASRNNPAEEIPGWP